MNERKVVGLLPHYTDEEIYLIWCQRQNILPAKNQIHDENRVWQRTEYFGYNEVVTFTHDGKWMQTRSTLQR